MSYEYLLGIGSNIEPRLTFLQHAYTLLSQLAVNTLESSRIYETKPLGAANKDFLNGVLRGNFDLEPLQLLWNIHKIESQLYRQRQEKWGNRTIDIDILMVKDGNKKFIHMQSPELTIPHPEILHRDFVLIPAQEIASSWMLAGRSLWEICKEYTDLNSINMEAYAPSLS